MKNIFDWSNGIIPTYQLSYDWRIELIPGDDNEYRVTLYEGNENKFQALIRATTKNEAEQVAIRQSLTQLQIHTERVTEVTEELKQVVDGIA